MHELKNPKIAIPIVLIAGILWSFGPYVVRHIDQPATVPWQYLFTRGIVIFILLNIYLYFEEGIQFIRNYNKVTAAVVLVIDHIKAVMAAPKLIPPIKLDIPAF